MEWRGGLRPARLRTTAADSSWKSLPLRSSAPTWKRQTNKKFKHITDQEAISSMKVRQEEPPGWRWGLCECK